MSTVTNLLLGGVRHYARRYAPKYKDDSGVRYGLITYFPKTPNHVDPPIEPTKLFMVQRIKKLSGTPWWEKEVMSQLHLDGKKSEVAIVKNTPETNVLLWQVKHLIKVTPIKCPDGIPKTASLNGSYLHENGTFMVNRKVTIDQKRIDAIDEYKKDWKKLDSETLRKDLRLKWVNPL
ncbi:39S ribosomal protein L30, mitochondrial [Neodiprion virginianus]|uniref:39S ribosomal protein L30, mitochondrial n=1 Tax=Neodiprion fabricii TaxID=2872261 RepID=UPI001ED8C8F4|nr:39S ribosomal protein L30, mitochondrial [Neodiprion fabricii]XP_046610235.1 39S ribosomal protein L30, mitochondrial [Neodiprion virginianus]